ncbi:MAG: DUF4282 domain-containing protein [Phycisphaerae bacterium]|nr:DUF4282 domain-containing protein [Phycisphaerae bacterium]
MGGLAQSGWFMEFAKFQKMITPVVIQVVFWIAIAGCVISALVSFGKGTGGSILGGILVLLLGPLVVRIQCELIILMFRIRDLLQEICDKTHK